MPLDYSRRELAIEVHDWDVQDRLHQVAQHDRKPSHPSDLSDKGLLADLEERVSEGAERLVLKSPKKKKAKRAKK